MPNSPTAFRLVDSAAKCRPTAASPSFSAIQARAAAALVRVSSVVKVFDATRNSVRAGSSPCTVAWNAWPSTLDRNRASIRASVRPMVSASVATRGPRSEPPMPMFTTVVSRSPVAPRWLPSWIAVTKPRMRSRSAAASLEASSMPPASAAFRPASRGERSAMCIAARCSVAFTISPANRRRRKPSRSAASASANSASSVSASMADFE